MTRRPELSARPLWATALVGVVGLAIALAYDSWYGNILVGRERERIRALSVPYANAIEGFFGRRIGRLVALRAFVEAEPTAASLAADFPTFAEGLATAATGVRAFQLVRDARIVITWPNVDSAQLVGYNLRQHPDSAVVNGVRRAETSDSVIITGPVRLLQGGDGFIVRLRVRQLHEELPDMVAMTLDLGSLISEADFGSLPDALQFGLIDRNGRLLSGTGSMDTPVRTSINVGDGLWTVLMAPARGWNAAVTDDLQTTRAASAMIWLLLVLVTASIVGRQQQLELAVEARTQDLELANTELRREGEERRQLEEQLLHSQKMEAVGTLAGGIAHDFNNLLTAIIGFAQLSDQHTVAMQHDATDPTQRERLHDLRVDVAEILKAADRASLLTSQLLAFSRRQKVVLSRVNVNAVVQDLERMLRRLIGERVALVTDIHAEPLLVMADTGQISQVIVNLVVNARDALPSGGTVRIRTSTVFLHDDRDASVAGLPFGEWVRLDVTDDGVGMSPDVMARVFEPFFTTKRIGDGTGLGLSTVYGIVAQAGGRVLLDSAPNAGTTVTVMLPRVVDSVASTPTQALPAVRTGGEDVLIVEDEPGLRRLVAEILRRTGYTVSVAKDGTEALELLSARVQPPDLIVTDVVMPRMGGRELALTLKAQGSGVPVLFMSGYQDGEELPDDIGYAFLSKPFTPDALVTRVRTALDART